MNNSMAMEYNTLVTNFDEKHKHQEPRPRGWYKFLDAGGKQHGYGFYCSTCQLILEPNAEKQEVRHCGGKVETLPGLFRRVINMPEYRVPKKLLLL